jgi:tripartite-type tricarboxylate transporter receptor subunit TctC
MKLPRRNFLHLAAGVAALATLSYTASALDYPTRPGRLIVGFPAGGLTDILGHSGSGSNSSSKISPVPAQISPLKRC